MIKKKSSISINILSALIILISLFMGVVGNTNAWFTSKHQDGIEIIFNVGDIRLKLYQLQAGEAKREITNLNNVDPDVEKQYIYLEGPIIPGEVADLNLQLENKEAGSAAMYVRYRFELYARVSTTADITRDELIPTTMVGGNAWSNGNAGFKYKESDNYYYYTNTTGEINEKLPYNETAQLMEGFTIDYNYIYNGGNYKMISSDALYIVLTVEAQLANF